MDPDFLAASWTLFESSSLSLHDDEDDTVVVAVEPSLSLFTAAAATTDDDDDNDGFVEEIKEKASLQHEPIRTQSLSEAIHFLSLPFERENLGQIEDIILTFMGSMAQCRIHGNEIKDLGAISSLMTILYHLICRWRWWENMHSSNPIESTSRHGSEYHQDDHGPLHYENDQQVEETTRKNKECDHPQYCHELKVASLILGALRDLSCGNASIRLQIGQYQINTTPSNMSERVLGEVASVTGIEIISYFVSKYSSCPWDEIPSLELKLMTNALGVARNITHSTTINCHAFHDVGMTKVFINRLLGRMMYSSVSSKQLSEEHVDAICCSLPDASKPWREACYRLAGTLINMGEKCQDAALECARDDDLLWILIESWGGVKDWSSFFHSSTSNKAIPVLHLGLYAILSERMKLVERGLTTTTTTTAAASHALDRRHILTTGSSMSSSSGSGSNSNSSEKRGEIALDQHRGNASSSRFPLLDVIHGIMEDEKRRKRVAQQREMARKKNIVHIENNI